MFHLLILQIANKEQLLQLLKKNVSRRKNASAFLVILFIYYKTMLLTNCRYVYEISSLEFDIRSLERHPNGTDVTKLLVATESTQRVPSRWIHDTLHIVCSV